MIVFGATTEGQIVGGYNSYLRGYAYGIYAILAEGKYGYRTMADPFTKDLLDMTNNSLNCIKGVIIP